MLTSFDLMSRIAKFDCNQNLKKCKIKMLTSFDLIQIKFKKMLTSFDLIAIKIKKI